MKDQLIKYITKINKIKLINIKFSYNNEFTLKVDTLEFTPGKYLLMGPNGAGKTTLLHIISGLYKPSSGRIIINDLIDIAELPDHIMSDIRRRTYAILLQEDVFIEHLSLRQNLELPFTLFNESPPRDLIYSLAKRMKIEHLLDRKPTALSGGEKRKASIVRALAKTLYASVVILDEPTSNLDEESVNAFMEIINEIEDKIVVIATHDVELTDIADVVIHMRNGIINQS